MRIAVFIAHPDDEAVGMGGTLIKLAAAGHEVQIVVTTVNARDGTKRNAEMLAATEVAGINTPLFFGVTDGELDVSRDIEEMLHSLVGFAPDAVFTLWSIDVHPDHRSTAALAIGRYLRKGTNTELYAMETCSAGRSSPGVRPQSLAFRPTHFVDVTDVLDRKRKMLSCHRTQDPDGMWSGVYSMMKNRGMENGVMQAEVFCRLTRVGNPPAWLTSIMRPTRWLLPRGIAADFDPSEIGL